MNHFGNTFDLNNHGSSLEFETDHSFYTMEQPGFSTCGFPFVPENQSIDSIYNLRYRNNSIDHSPFQTMNSVTMNSTQNNQINRVNQVEVMRPYLDNEFSINSNDNNKKKQEFDSVENSNSDVNSNSQTNVQNLNINGNVINTPNEFPGLGVSQFMQYPMMYNYNYPLNNPYSYFMPNSNQYSYFKPEVKLRKNKVTQEKNEIKPSKRCYSKESILPSSINFNALSTRPESKFDNSSSIIDLI